VVSAEREFRRGDLDMSRLAADARGMPAFDGGALVGIRLLSLVPGSIYDQAGLRAGDVVQRVNGHRLTSPDAALEAYAELRTATWVELEVHRGDSVLLLRYQLH
jgi:general secretion pathway protein C